MTFPDPDDPDRRAADDDNATATDTRFAEIVSGWRSDPDAPRWPDDDAAPDPEPAAHVAPVVPVDDGHYVPPEPPPLPTLRPRTFGGLAVLGAGVLLLLAPSVLDLSEQVGTPLGLLTLTGGFVWLAIGLRSGPPSDSGWDDGAQL